MRRILTLLRGLLSYRKENKFAQTFQPEGQGIENSYKTVKIMLQLTYSISVKHEIVELQNLKLRHLIKLEFTERWNFDSERQPSQPLVFEVYRLKSISYQKTSTVVFSGKYRAIVLACYSVSWEIKKNQGGYNIPLLFSKAKVGDFKKCINQ